jgi:hypothetical protein
VVVVVVVVAEEEVVVCVCVCVRAGKGTTYRILSLTHMAKNAISRSGGKHLQSRSLSV